MCITLFLFFQIQTLHKFFKVNRALGLCAYERLRGGRALVENVTERTPMSVMAISERGN